MSERRLVVIVNPPNTDDLEKSSTIGVIDGVQHTDWANMPHLGILSLASVIDATGILEPVYFDGVVCPWDFIQSFIREQHDRILALCVSCLTASYGAALALLQSTKQADRDIVTILGNDHFSAYYREILYSRHEIIDYGFVGNEVLHAVRDLLVALKKNEPISHDKFSGLSYYIDGQVHMTKQAPESICADINYTLIDRYFDHSRIYTENFGKRLRPRLYEVFHRDIRRGIPIEIARGCIKFNNNDACSFCSIQYGGMWKNALENVHTAWDVLLRAFEQGYEYLYITADELPLTFASLIKRMHESMPAQWRALAEDERPIITGYARADGISKIGVLSMLRQIGVRILMIGLDGGTSRSLAALNKPLLNRSADELARQNVHALQNAKALDIKIKAGFVMGHIGMDQELLRGSVENIKALIKEGADALLSVDIELLSPEPGSKDFLYLTKPELASTTASRLGVRIAGDRLRHEIAEAYSSVDHFHREQAMRDYCAALLPECSIEELAAARESIREYASSLGILVGQGL